MYKLFSDLTMTAEDKSKNSTFKFYDYNEEDVCAVWEKKREGVWRGNILLLNHSSSSKTKKARKEGNHNDEEERELKNIADVYASQEQYCTVC